MFRAALRRHCCSLRLAVWWGSVDPVALRHLKLLKMPVDSWLGEGGRQLSGGELRRLAIARALLHDAPLVLLDEPTEGFSATTESQILELLAEMMREKTVLMVTHRLRGLSRFQRIIVMDNGQIIEQVYHAELLARQGRYYQFKQGL